MTGESSSIPDDTATRAAHVVIADRGDDGGRLDLVLRRALAGTAGATRTRIQRWIANGRVAVNGRISTRPAARVARGDRITVDATGKRPRPVAAEDGAIEILFEDDCLVAINKPPGVVCHPTHAHAAGTLLNAVTGYARTWPAEQRPSLVGRLDKLTSGIVLVAKSAAAHRALQRALADRTAAKDYLALVHGRMPARGHIALPLRRDHGDRRRVVAAEDGAPSRTDYERLELFRAAGTTLSVVRCRLVTGRTHQIRVHLSASGWPIVGDPQYGETRWSGVTSDELRDALRAFPRQALHAARLSFVHPVAAHRVTIDAPLPRDLEAIVKLIRAHTL